MNEPLGVCTGVTILVTGLTSYLGFRSRHVEEKYLFHTEGILAGKEYYRLLTSGFLHADWWHLLLNMASLYLFGNWIELIQGKAQFCSIYLGAIVGGNLLSLYVHRHHDYRAYGASGGVCGIIFAHILLFPGSGVRMWMIPLAIPGWIYALLFMLGSFYSLKASRDNIGHDAHLGGGIIGLLIAAGLNPGTARHNYLVLLTVLGVGLALLVYLWVNPLFLPLESFRNAGSGSRLSCSKPPNYKREALRIDEILEKISRNGMASLSAEEKKLLKETSSKYQRRAQSRKPGSDLPI